MKRFLLNLFSGGYYLLISLFCFAALNSYTYIFLVKTPPYLWLEWFARHAAWLYWAAMAAGVAAHWGRKRHPLFVASWIAQLLVGILFSVQQTALTIHNDWTAFAWALALLLPAMAVAIADTFVELTKKELKPQPEFLPYPQAVAVALLGAGVSIFAILLRDHFHGVAITVHRVDVKTAVFTLAEYLWVALLAVTVINLLQYVLRARVRSTWPTCTWAAFVLILFAVYISLLRFLNSTLSVKGWPIDIYSFFLSVYVVCWGSGLWMALSAKADAEGKGESRHGRLRLWLFLSGLLFVALMFPYVLGSEDWNGAITGTFYIFFWTLLGVTVYGLFPRRAKYSFPAIVAVVLVAGSAYWILHATAFLWAKELGVSDEEISIALQERREKNDAWELVHKAFHYRIEDSCGDTCRTLRQFSNLPDPQVLEPNRLVEDLRPASGKLPNIFIFVIDSLRPDYVGAYNKSVDFTPNIDSLASDSVVMQNAYTQYAGTSLSEPAIWSGALLLHAHYMRPFEKVNSLRTLLQNDGYDVAVSFDHILRRILPASDRVTRLDLDKSLPQFEISSTLQQLTGWMDGRVEKGRPIFFYAQPMNIHQLAKNDLPPRNSQNWRSRPGFSDRIAYELQQVDESLGGFVRYLKTRGLYDNSIIIITADHGESLSDLPGFGLQRRGHSSILFPEGMHVPLIIHLPKQTQGQVVWDENRVAALTDITPTLYYLLGHGPLRRSAVFGQSLFYHSAAEMDSCRRDHLLLASDVSAEYGELSGDGRYLYALYDAPLRSMLFDLKVDPKGTHNLVTDDTARQYNKQIIDDLQGISKFYGHRPTGGTSTGFAWDEVGDWH